MGVNAHGSFKVGPGLSASKEFSENGVSLEELSFPSLYFSS
jgi:hypothetical protein